MCGLEQLTCCRDQGGRDGSGVQAVDRELAVLGDLHAPANGLDSRPEDSALAVNRSEEHTSELQSLMRISDAAFCLKQTIIENVFIIPSTDTNEHALSMRTS